MVYSPPCSPLVNIKHGKPTTPALPSLVLYIHHHIRSRSQHDLLDQKRFLTLKNSSAQPSASYALDLCFGWNLNPGWTGPRNISLPFVSISLIDISK